MSYERLAHALLHGRQYYGPALQSLQGLPERHRCVPAVVAAAAAASRGRPLHALEIGSWAGASAVSWATALKEQAQGGRLVCVDTWRPYFDLEIEQESIYAGMNAAAEQGDVFRLFLHNLRAADVADIVEYRIGASRDILPQLPPSSFDIIYVDGSHAVDDVASDLSHATRLIRDGGIVCGDDLEVQRDAVAAEEHAAALASGRDYLRAESADAHYHPGVTDAVARVLGPVFAWNGFWAARRRAAKWEPVELQPGALPPHIEEALRGLAADSPAPATEDTPASVGPEIVADTVGYNLVRLGDRYIAVAKALGPVSLGVETIGDRELAPLVFVGGSVDELRSRVAVHEQSLTVELVEQTPTYNLVRFGSGYLAVALTLGPVSLGEERIGERELAPHILSSPTLEELRARVAACEEHAARTPAERYSGER